MPESIGNKGLRNDTENNYVLLITMEPPNFAILNLHVILPFFVIGVFLANGIENWLYALICV